MVGVPGLEPGTSALSGLRSNQLSYTPNLVCLPSKALAKNGGGRRARTDDILLAKQVLYQLSYTPFIGGRCPRLASLN